MSTTAPKDTKSTTTIPGQPGSGQRSVASSSTSMLLSARRVNAPRAVIGGLGVVVCAMGAVAASHVLDPRTPTLLVTQPVAAGQLITAADLQAVPVAAGNGIDVIPAAQISTVVGRPAALPLTAGALLNSADVGPAVFPPAGQAVAAVGLKAGMYPLHLAAGDRVQVVLPAQPGVLPAPTPAPTAASAASAAQAQPLVATVTAVGRPDTQGVMVANLLMDADGAARVAAASTSMSGVAVTLLPAGDS
ncbi:SAF domain-containing protein [Catenulispora pinisilvae]|uniref:SAF domain-containing protein n=2 Tax=Catenulispora pinisilvae TaxID=2705253 RepID=UPI0018913860|nr:SAF domain-containing protein [Catenulispora pinisilvae]